MEEKKQARILVFYSYAPADKEWLDQLITHLSQLKHDELIEDWHDQMILAGSECDQAIDQAIHSAQIILLLISADYLASDIHYNVEMLQALERHKRGEARVIPIIVRPCDWQVSPFGKLQCLPRNKQPITSWGNKDEAFLAIAEGVRQVIEQQQFPPPYLSDEQREDRTRLLQQARAWVEGWLEQALHEAIKIELHLQRQVENPLQGRYQELKQPPYALPVDTSIVEVYDEADRELLILGEPGSGKTMLLFQLAQTLLDRAEADEQQPLPIVFNLSSWTKEDRSLATWLEKELHVIYRISRKAGKHWVEGKRLLPLLDGLDEVAEEARVGCAQAITIYYEEHLNQAGVSLVICCRSKEYRKLSLPLRWVINILPLTEEQIEAYLSMLHGPLDGLRQALHNDAQLHELAQYPLMLNVFALAYEGIEAEAIPTEESLEALQRKVFVDYVERMLNRRGISKRIPPEKMVRVLAKIAGWMKQGHMPQFNPTVAQWLVPLQSLTVLLLALINVSLGIAAAFGYLLAFAKDSQRHGAAVKYWTSGLFLQLLGGVLDEATERLLLRKINIGGYMELGSYYMFIHPLLLEYFASLDESEASGHTSS